MPAFDETAGVGSEGCGVFLEAFSIFGASVTATGRCDAVGAGASVNTLASLSCFSASISASRARMSSCNCAYCSSSSRMLLIVSSLSLAYSTSNIASRPREGTRRRPRAIWKFRWFSRDWFWARSLRWECPQTRLFAARCR